MHHVYPGLVAASAALLLCAPPACADPAVEAMMMLVSSACAPNLGNPVGVRAWARAHGLAEIKDADALRIFEGEGGAGAAWDDATPAGHLVLALRGTTLGCAVFARAAEPAAVEASFARLIKQATGPTVTATVDSDTRDQTPLGLFHQLIYTLATPGAPYRTQYLLITVEKGGGPFQALIEEKRIGTAALANTAP